MLHLNKKSIKEKSAWLDLDSSRTVILCPETSIGEIFDFLLNTQQSKLIFLQNFLASSNDTSVLLLTEQNLF